MNRDFCPRLPIRLACSASAARAALLVLVLAAPAAWADERTPRPSAPPSVESVFGGDRFAAGGSVSVTTPTQGDLIAAGGRIEQEAAVGGDAVLVGGELRPRGTIAGSLYAGGGRLFIGAEVGRNLRAAGGQVELSAPARVAGNATLAGGEVRLRAPVKGAVRIAGGTVLVDAPVDGDLEITAEHIELGSQARVGGALRWRSPNELQRDAAAKVEGAVQRLPMPEHEEARRGERSTASGAGALFASALWTSGLMIVAAVALALLPGATARVEQGLLARWGTSLLLGLATLVCVPVAIVLLLVTVVGAPLALLALLAYLALVPLGYVAGAAALGRFGLARWKAAEADHRGWRIGATLVALLALAVVGRIPYLGTLVILVLWLTGLGAITRLLLPRTPEPHVPGGQGSF